MVERWPTKLGLKQEGGVMDDKFCNATNPRQCPYKIQWIIAGEGLSDVEIINIMTENVALKKEIEELKLKIK